MIGKLDVANREIAHQVIRHDRNARRGAVGTNHLNDTGELRREYWSEAARYSGIAFTADSKGFVASSEHGSFALFDCATGVAQSGYRVPGNWVNVMAPSADGTRMFMLVMDRGSRLDCWNLTKAR